MHATFLGSADGHTSSKRAHSGIFLQDSNRSLLLDCGANVAQYLVAQAIDPDHPHAIWLSHLHSDHIGQFPMLIQSLWLRSRKAPLHIYTPKKAIHTLKDYLEKCLLFPELIGFPILWHGLTAKKKYSLGNLTLTAFPTAHLLSLSKYYHRKYPETCFDCFGLILEIDGERILYSADLASPHELHSHLKKPVRALICELTHFPEVSLFKELAKAKPIKKTLLTHFADDLVKQEKQLKRLANDCHYHSEIQLVQEGKTISL